jgi:transcriptional regulator with XRE-family HTH domain
MSIGELIRARRQAHGLSLARLARRAGTSPAWLSRVERGLVSPSFTSVERVLLVLGEELTIGAEPIDPLVERELLDEQAGLDPEERLRQSLDWNAFAEEIAAAGPRARRR